MSAEPERIDLLRQALIFHGGAKKQLERVQVAQRTMMDEISVGKWTGGRPAPGTGDAEFRFEYEYHFLLVAAAKLDKAMRTLGFAGLARELAGPIKDLRDWYTHFEDPEGGAFHSFIVRKETADPSKLILTSDDIGGQVLRLSDLAVARDALGSKLPAYEQRLLPQDAK